MIEVDGLSKRYGACQALSDVSFRVGRGEIVGLLGPNGAGKTTILKILSGYLQPDSGAVYVDGLDVVTQPRAAQAHIGYLPENTPLYPELSVQAYLKLIADLRGIAPSERRERLSEAIYATGLQECLTQPIKQLSKGFRRRVGLAQAILHRPPILILDEPSVGLDPAQIVELRHLIKRLSYASTILFSTHILSEVEAICDRALILINGALRADNQLAALRNSGDALLVLDTPVKEAPGLLQELDGVCLVEPVANDFGYPSYRVAGHHEADLCPAVYALASARKWPVRELRSDGQSLESLFARLAA
jgi:ABC-2 type transport system ATP-binding protein